eukprot:Skav230555  [mRNA]  locus=scaffold4799:50194:51588:- [translate_table: standard]
MLRGLVFAGCLAHVKSANVEVIAVGAEIEQLAGDDAYTGSTIMDFLLYVKQTVVDESVLIGDRCPHHEYLSKSPPAGNFSLKLVNAKGSPNLERTDFTECPTGAQFPGEGFWCRTFSKTLGYTIDTQSFPFDYQDFRIDLQDDGPPPLKKFCYINSVSSSPNFDTSLWSTPPTFRFEQRNQSYPPNRLVDNQKRSKCSFIWRTNRSMRKAIPRFCMVPAGVVILCVAILALKPETAGKERLASVVALIWTINSFYSSTMQGLSLRSKEIGIFESFVWWNYLLILIISVDSCVMIISQARETREVPAECPAATGEGLLLETRRVEEGTAGTAVEPLPGGQVETPRNASADREKFDRDLRWLILIFSGLQAIAVALAVNIPEWGIGNALRDFFRKSLFVLQGVFVFCVILSSFFVFTLRRPAFVDRIGQPLKTRLWRRVTQLCSWLKRCCHRDVEDGQVELMAGAA